MSHFVCHFPCQPLQSTNAYDQAEKSRPGKSCSKAAHSVEASDELQCMPPYHPIFGHLLVVNRFLSKLPRDMHLQCLPGQIRREIPDVGPVFYLDMWPFTLPILVVSSPSAAYQLTQERSPPKTEGLRRFMRPLAQNEDLVSLEGQPWKHWRNVFNPGFSAGHLINLVPQIAKEVSTFCEILRERAQVGDLFPLEEATVNLTMDTIGRVAL